MGEQGIAAGKPKKQYLRFVAGFLGIVIFVVAGYFALRFYFRNEEFIKKQKQDQEIIEYYAALEKKIKEDTYGGETPEETLQLFIDALKAGDTDLAAKYFVVEEQEEQGADLLIGKNSGTIEKFIDFLSSALKDGHGTFKDDSTYILEIINSNNKVEFSFVLVKNPNNKWKILEL